MNNEYIDKFIESGSFRLSSYDKFRNYPDEVRGDKQEGMGAIHALTGPTENIHIVQRTILSYSMLMISSSFLLSEELKKDFETDGCFEITDVKSFADAVAEGIAHYFKAGVVWHTDACIYDNDGIKVVQGGYKTRQDFDNINLLSLFSVENQIYSDLHLKFLKREKYKYQKEFRFVFEVHTDKIPEEIDIVIPEATKHIKKI